MFTYTRIRSTNVLQSMLYICQKDINLFNLRSSFKKLSWRTVSSTSVPLRNVETSLISNDCNDTKALSTDIVQAQLQKYNDSRIIFNSITFRRENYLASYCRESRQLQRSKQLLSSESLIYQRLKNIQKEKYEEQINDPPLNDESLYQTPNTSESATNRCQQESPIISTRNKTEENYEFNVIKTEENCSKPIHSKEGVEKDIILTPGDASMKSISTYDKIVSQEENHFSNKSNEEIVIGSADESVPKSSVKCSGCGALQHCQDPGLPGFKPYEKFVGVPDDELRLTVCYRCHFLTGFDIAVPTTQSPQSFRTVLRPVRSLSSLVLLMVDLTDAPCSIHPDTLQIIARRQPVIVVGSKVDLLPLSGPTCLARAREALDALIQRTTLADANILSTCLVSGHTGYGVEDLVSIIFKKWQQKGKFLGDVFLVGCTNSGKSTLYNALLQSDLSDQLAGTCSLPSTTSTWPATTVDMIKFPMLLWTPWHAIQAGCGDTLPPPAKYLRQLRIERERLAARDTSDLPETDSFTRDPAVATLTGTVGRTNVMDGPPPRSQGLFSLEEGSTRKNSRRRMKKIEEEEMISYNPDARVFEGYTYCYDTPGLVQPHQFLGLLTQEELRLVLPDQLIVPETFSLKPGMSLFIGGLARLDVLHLHHEKHVYRAHRRNQIKVTVFRSRALPVSIVKSVAASSFHRDYLGSGLLRVPMGSEARLRHWPALEPCNITAVGVHKTEADADVVLSSAGWVSLCVPPGSECQLRAWTPGGRGTFLREPALLPLAGTESTTLLRGSVVHCPNLLYVAQPKRQLGKTTENNDFRTHFPEITDGRTRPSFSLGQISPRLLVSDS